MTEQTTPQAQPTRKDALLAKKRAIETELRALAARESSAKRKAETKAKIIIGGLVLTNRREIIKELATKAAPRDVEHLKGLGLL
jgi:hypothetical protein